VTIPNPSEPASPAPYQHLQVGTATALGARADNQDRVSWGDGWAVVSDGMGGYAGGGRAAELTVAAVAAVLAGAGEHPATLVLEAIERANAEVRAERDMQSELARMGATVTVAASAGAGRWVVANVGDSPAWLVGAGGTEVVSEEHNLTGELVRTGALDPAGATGHPGRRVLTRAVGIEAHAVPAVATVAPVPGQRLILASDGVAGGVDPGTLYGLLGPTESGSASSDAEQLVEAAIAGGATDNVTVVVLRFT